MITRIPFPFTLPLLLLLAATTTSASSRTSKAGLPWPSSQWVPMTGFQGVNTSITWYYTWSPSPVTYTSRSSWGRTKAPSPPFAFVPQIWGIDDARTSEFLQALDTNFSSTTTLPSFPILTYNEPNEPTQALCSPSDAARHWRTHLEPLRQVNGGKYTLGSPAVTSAPDGKVWLNEFLGNCSGCGWDFTTVHWYDLEIDAFIEYINDFHHSFGNKSIWVTEWACHNFNFPGQASEDAVHEFMDRTIGYMDSVDWVDRYAWFAPAYDMQNVSNFNSLFRNTSGDFERRSGVPSVLGVQFAGVNGTREAEESGAAAEVGKAWSGLLGVLLVVAAMAMM